MKFHLSGRQIKILSTIRDLGPQRVNRALGSAEITEVLRLHNPEDTHELYASVQSDLQALAAMGLVEHYRTLHEWRLTEAGEAVCSGTDCGEPRFQSRPPQT
jgi:hypothetical protein